MSCLDMDQLLWGGVTIPDGVAVGACALVLKTVERENVAVAGVPAKIISENGSKTWNRQNRSLE